MEYVWRIKQIIKRKIIQNYIMIFDKSTISQPLTMASTYDHYNIVYYGVP